MDTIDDANQYNEVIRAMKTMEMSQQEQNDLFAIVASVLHMGNVGFSEEDGMATILKPAAVDAVASVIISELVCVKIVNIFARSKTNITVKIISLLYFVKIISVFFSSFSFHCVICSISNYFVICA